MASGGSDNALFSITGNQLSILVSPNYEQRQSYSIRVRASDNGPTNSFFEKDLSISVTNLNEAPTDISLTNGSVAENSGPNAAAGTLSAIDPEGGSFTFSLVNGVGGEDNSLVNLNGDALTLNPSANFEVKPSYSILVQATDNGSPGLDFTKALVVQITNVNEAPTDIVILTGGSVAENGAANATVATFSATDPDAGATHTFSLIGGGDHFTMQGNTLRITNPANFEVQASYNVRVQAADSANGALTFQKDFIITVTDVDEAPTDIALSASSIAENNPANATVGNLSATDPDPSSTHNFSLVSGAGATDNANFTINGGVLSINPQANYEGKSSYSVRIRASDSANASLSTERIFPISITDVNEAPAFTKGHDQVLIVGTTTAQSIPNWATGIDDGDSLATQSLGFSVSLQSGAGLFSVAPAIAPDGTLTFTPTGLPGVANLTVTLTDDASINATPTLTNAQTFTIEVANPEITLTGNGVSIDDGDTSPRTEDDTDFGLAAVDGGTIVRTFQISNGGQGSLTVSSVTRTGHPDFSVTTQPVSPVAPGTPATFQVTFDPQAEGTRQAILSFTNNDPDESPVHLHDPGTGGIPEIVVEEGGQGLTSGSSQLLFGRVAPGASQTKTVTIRNTGASELTGLVLSRTGAHPSDFSASALSSTTLPLHRALKSSLLSRPPPPDRAPPSCGLLAPTRMKVFSRSTSVGYPITGTPNQSSSQRARPPIPLKAGSIGRVARRALTTDCSMRRACWSERSPRCGSMPTAA